MKQETTERMIESPFKEAIEYAVREACKKYDIRKISWFPSNRKVVS